MTHFSCCQDLIDLNVKSCCMTVQVRGDEKMVKKGINPLLIFMIF